MLNLLLRRTIKLPLSLLAKIWGSIFSVLFFITFPIFNYFFKRKIERMSHEERKKLLEKLDRAKKSS